MDFSQKVFVVNNPSKANIFITEKHNTLHITHNTVDLHSAYTQMVKWYFLFRYTSAHTATEDAVVFGVGRTLKAIVFFTSLSTKKSLSLNGDRNKSKAPHAAFSSPSSPRKISTFLVLAKPPEARPYTSYSWSLIPKKF